MALNLFVLIRDYLTKLAASLKRFPEPLLLATAAVVVLIILNHLKAPVPKATSDYFTRIAMVLALGVPLSLSLRVLGERLPSLPKTIRISLYPLAAAGLALYFLFLLPDFKTLSLIRYTALSLSLYLAFLFIPYAFKREQFELYTTRLFTNFTVTYLYSIILFGGLAAILFTLNKLFGAKVSKLYLDFWLAVIGVFAPAFFLADVPERSQELQVDTYPKVFRVLLLYIVIPIITVYSAILYVYFAKIIITRQWPIGIVANLVLWYSIISTVVIFFIYPLRNLNKWIPRFLSLAPKLILPLMIMMFFAIGIRVQAYGVTENRYFVILAGLWATGCLGYLLFAKIPKKNIILPVSAALLAVLAVTGPWSCDAVSKQSQNYRLEKILKQNQMLQAGDLVKPERELPAAVKKEISSILGYFQRHHRLRDVKYLPKNFKLTQMPQVFGFKYINADIGRYGEKFFSEELTGNGEVLSIEGYDYFVGFSESYQQNETTTSGPIRVSYSTENRDLIITGQGKELYRKNIGKLVTGLLKDTGTGGITPTREQRRFPDQNEHLQVLYVFKQINGVKDTETGALTLNYLDFYLFIKLN